jgi:hypothetical protein
VADEKRKESQGPVWDVTKYYGDAAKYWGRKAQDFTKSRAKKRQPKGRSSSR